MAGSLSGKTISAPRAHRVAVLDARPFDVTINDHGNAQQATVSILGGA
jgi:hypothetical protein